MENICAIILSLRFVKSVSISSPISFYVDIWCNFSNSQYLIDNIYAEILVKLIIFMVLKFISEFGIGLDKPLIFSDMLEGWRAEQQVQLLLLFAACEYSRNNNVPRNKQIK